MGVCRTLVFETECCDTVVSAGDGHDIEKTTLDGGAELYVLKSACPVCSSVDVALTKIGRK